MATWNPTAIYGQLAALSDAELVRWALEEMAADLAQQANMASDPARIHGPRSRPRLAEAAAYQAVSDRLAALADPIAEVLGHQPA